MSITPLGSIKRSQYINWIRVRVTRAWRPRKFQSDNYDGMHYQLVDEKGDSIHAIVDEHDYMHTSKMKQGSIYDIYHVHVKGNSNSYKVVDRDIEIGFNEMSTIVAVQEEMCSIPKFAYHLIEFHGMEECFDNQQKMEKEKKRILLADLYGCVKEVIPPRTIFVSGRNANEWICEVVLENHRRETVKITLWSDVARDFNMKTVDKSDSSTFAVFTSLKMKKYKGDITPTGTNHTCVFFNPEIPQRVDYAAEFNKPGDRTRINKSRSGGNIDESWKTILDLRKLDATEYKDKIVLCHAKVVRFPSHSGWWYNSCSVQRCPRQLKFKSEANCYTCGVHGDQAAIPVYKVFMTIQDDRDQITVTLFGRQAENLFGHSCLDLINRRIYADEHELPCEINDKIGQTFLFELKIGFNNEYVVKHVHPDPEKPDNYSVDKELDDVSETDSVAAVEHASSSTPNQAVQKKRMNVVENSGTSVENKDKKSRRLIKDGIPCFEDSSHLAEKKET